MDFGVQCTDNNKVGAMQLVCQWGVGALFYIDLGKELEVTAPTNQAQWEVRQQTSPPST